jgi:hypothetical protein
VAEFDPRQLDQLEDALEHLGDHGDHDLESLQLPAEVTERLGEYEDVLALCRDAFPLESPRDELLAVVIAEAHDVSGRPRSRGAVPGRWRRVWERWRGTVVPGFALAATAAVMLWVLDPDAQLEHATELQSDRVDDSSKAELERSQPASESSNELGKSEALDLPEPQLPTPEPTPEQHDTTERPNPKPSPGGKPAKSKLDVPVPEPVPAPEPMNKDETWTTLEQANAARRTGNCDRARKLYDEVIAASSDSLAIAQAKAGIGLCFEQDRRDSEAKKWFDDARGDSPGIDAWINDQREEQPLPGEIKKPRSKKDMALDDVDAL